MKRSRLFNRFCLVFFAISLFIMGLSIATDVVSWSNGSEDGQNRGTYLNYNVEIDYGTHDWVAEFALEKLLANPILAAKWIDVELNFFWNDQTKKAFLHGTAGPDLTPPIYHVTRYGQVIQGESDVVNHNQVFTRNGAGAALAAGKADDCGRAAILALMDGDCTTAAFFMGEMAHYITDMSCFFHTTPEDLNRPVNWKYLHHRLEEIVQRRTTGKAWAPGFGWDNFFSVGARESYFRTRVLVIQPPLGPFTCAEFLAYDTFFQSSMEYRKHFNWMYDTFSSRMYKDTEWRHYNRDWMRWDLSPEGSAEDEKYKFIKSIEDSLNNAIDYVATALDWVINQVVVFECKLGWFDVTNQGLVPGQVADTYISTFAKEAIFRVTGFIGTYGTLYAIALAATKRLEELIPFGKPVIYA